MMNFTKDGEMLIKGRLINDDPITIPQALTTRGQRVVVYGDIFNSESRDVKGERRIVTYKITDFSGSILIKLFDPVERKRVSVSLYLGKLRMILLHMSRYSVRIPLSFANANPEKIPPKESALNCIVTPICLQWTLFPVLAH